MKILGIDPALTYLRWGIIKINSPKIFYIDSGIIKSSALEQMHKRLANIRIELKKIIEINLLEAIAMEETFINMNMLLLLLNLVRGAIMSLIGEYDLPFCEYKPNSIKKAIVGVGHAEIKPELLILYYKY